jgi:hypothetical protein
LTLPDRQRKLAAHMQPSSSAVAIVDSSEALFLERRRVADRVFRGVLAFNTAVTVFWLVAYLRQDSDFAFGPTNPTLQALTRVLGFVLFFYVVWGFIWYAIKNVLLKYVARFSKEERRQAFSSRMDTPYDVADLVSRHSERRIRIVDMIGRRGRFITLAASGFYFLYLRVLENPSPAFISAGLADNLFDALLTNWIFLAFFYANGFLAAAFYGPQSRVMDGVLARANCLLITTLWLAFKFVLVPIGGQLAATFSPQQFAPVFALIWGSYIAADASAEIGGALFGKQTIRVRGIGDVNRKSVGGTISGFVASLALCLIVVFAHGLPTPWIGLAIVIAVSNSVLELFSPRGTDDFTMATTNALICWGFGALIY